jgi:hypothetical protein
MHGVTKWSGMEDSENSETVQIVSWINDCKHGREMNPLLEKWRRYETANVRMTGGELKPISSLFRKEN